MGFAHYIDLVPLGTLTKECALFRGNASVPCLPSLIPFELGQMDGAMLEKFINLCYNMVRFVEESRKTLSDTIKSP